MGLLADAEPASTTVNGKTAVDLGNDPGYGVVCTVRVREDVTAETQR